MGRRLLAFGLCIAVEAGALSGPLVHAHVGGGHDDHHASGRVHAHLNGHAAPTQHRHDSLPAMHSAEPPERVVPLKLFVATYAGIMLDPALAPVHFLVAPPAGSLMRRPPQVVRSHGPPGRLSSVPRAPPPFSVLI